MHVFAAAEAVTLHETISWIRLRTNIEAANKAMCHTGDLVRV
jgi:hypothetical protein